MRIRGAIGLGMTIIVLKFLVSGAFHAFEATVINGFDFANAILHKAELSAEAGYPLPLRAPQLK